MSPQVEILDDLLGQYVGYHPSYDTKLEDLPFGLELDPLTTNEWKESLADFLVALEETFHFRFTSETINKIGESTSDDLLEHLKQEAIKPCCCPKPDPALRSQRRLEITQWLS